MNKIRMCSIICSNVKKIPNDMFDNITVGDESEATNYVQENMHLWEDAGELLERFGHS